MTGNPISVPILSTILLILAPHLLPAEQLVTTNDGRTIVLYDDHTWAESPKAKTDDMGSLVTLYKPKLRRGTAATDAEILAACELLSQGWTYHMPHPKSPQAAWGNGDRRTTWFNGWWYNDKTKLYSDTTPAKSASGLYLGDNQNSADTWRRGGSPAMPDVYMFLLSPDGGPTRR